MTHPTHEELQAWLDGEIGSPARAESVGSHVADCVSCRERTEGGRQLGAMVRMWADDAAPRGPGDLADRIFAATARSMGS